MRKAFNWDDCAVLLQPERLVVLLTHDVGSKLLGHGHSALPHFYNVSIQTHYHPDFSRNRYNDHGEARHAFPQCSPGHKAPEDTTWYTPIHDHSCYTLSASTRLSTSRTAAAPLSPSCTALSTVKSHSGCRTSHSSCRTSHSGHCTSHSGHGNSLFASPSSNP